jgi:cyanophycin synthetase
LRQGVGYDWSDISILSNVRLDHIGQGDRGNVVIEQAGRIAGRGFHRLIIKEDYDLRGRQSGETADILCRAARTEAPNPDCRVILNEAEALRTVLSEIETNEIVLVFYEKLDGVLVILKEFGAVPAKSLAELSFQTAAGL